ncbi:hypothetical protein [Neptuniibacter sp. QD37_11]|uniref:hypothetical protein n=1 Tax=Neptuniibacter sp. QD37_11 TaxID=3398209 RepID=UPI0039F47121
MKFFTKQTDANITHTRFYSVVTKIFSLCMGIMAFGGAALGNSLYQMHLANPEVSLFGHLSTLPLAYILPLLMLFSGVAMYTFYRAHLARIVNLEESHRTPNGKMVCFRAAQDITGRWLKVFIYTVTSLVGGGMMAGYHYHLGDTFMTVVGVTFCIVGFILGWQSAVILRHGLAMSLLQLEGKLSRKFDPNLLWSQ